MIGLFHFTTSSGTFRFFGHYIIYIHKTMYKHIKIKLLEAPKIC